MSAINIYFALAWLCKWQTLKVSTHHWHMLAMWLKQIGFQEDIPLLKRIWKNLIQICCVLQHYRHILWHLHEQEDSIDYNSEELNCFHLEELVDSHNETLEWNLTSIYIMFNKFLHSQGRSKFVHVLSSWHSTVLKYRKPVLMLNCFPNVLHL